MTSETQYENRICFFDLEATGLDTANDRITQIAWAICDLDSKAILAVGMKYLYTDMYPPITEEITALTGITQPLLQKFGTAPNEALGKFKDDLTMYNVGYLCAHNLKGYDGPLLKAEMERAGLHFESPVEVDTRIDIDYPPAIKTRGLLHLASEHQFLPFQAHDALFDVLTLRKLFFFYEWRTTIENAKTPKITVHISTNYNTKDEAKARGYYWDGNSKRWLKDIKETNLEEEQKKGLPFNVVVVQDVSKKGSV